MRRIGLPTGREAEAWREREAPRAKRRARSAAREAPRAKPRAKRRARSAPFGKFSGFQCRFA
jgi:hypothetical protein